MSPCDDGGRDEPSAADEVYPVLCGIMSVLEAEQSLKRVLDKVDWREAGVTRAFAERWWKNHKEDDEERRREEEEERREAIDRKAALKKLTKRDREVLGL